MVKRIGGGRPPARDVEFELAVSRHGTEDIISFTAAVSEAPAELMQIMANAEQRNDAESARMTGALTRMLGKLMRDDDGVPHAWAPLMMAKDDPAVPEHLAGRPCYRGPGGEVAAFDDTPKLRHWQDVYVSGSSARRWHYLMNQDDEAIVYLRDIMDVAEYMLQEASQRPTEPRA